ncbi:cytochrome P450 71B26-like [Pyrus ussuriensis x Pyrus communis]|uniref:Cytochrome P450 71B26-like n=1 Tax=Pyrus ussuriensis x Pyrus communis TaxID=2448454 RepID=A0A5N5H9Y9_9ROSA|nr:cytochrome P450 71B26-like [Pyrus ussuriensis x Pyrus communis]
MALIAPFFIWLPFLLLLIPLLQLKKKQHLPNKPQKQNPLPPSPPKLPLIGNLHQLGSSLHQSLWQLSKNRPSSTGARRLTYNYLDIGFSPYVQSYRKIREEEVDKMVNSISASSSSGVPVDLTEKLFAIAASIIFRIAYGTSYRGSKFEHAKSIYELIQDTEAMLGGMYGADYFPSWIGWVIDRVSGVHKELDRISKELDGFFQQVIDDHLKPRRRVDDEQTHEDIVDLANNPGLMKKAQEEVRKCIGNKGKVTETETDHLQYLKMVIKETLRLHPPAPTILPRETASRCKIQGYDIDPKTLVLVNAWAIARDLRFWKDPEEFIPERFDGSSVDYKGQHFEFLPFGAGRRVCPGIYIWERQRWSLDLQIFSWKLPDGMEEDLNMEETSGSLSLTVSKKTPLNLIPVKFCQKE